MMSALPFNAPIITCLYIAALGKNTGILTCLCGTAQSWTSSEDGKKKSPQMFLCKKIMNDKSCKIKKLQKTDIEHIGRGNWLLNQGQSSFAN